MILSFEDVFEDSDVDVGEGEVVFVESKQQKPFVEGDVDKEPEGFVLVVADDEQVADNEVDSLGVAHSGEVVRDSFEDEGEMLFLEEGHLKSSIEIFLNLGEAFMLENAHILILLEGVVLPTLLLGGCVFIFWAGVLLPICIP